MKYTREISRTQLMFSLLVLDLIGANFRVSF